MVGFYGCLLSTILLHYSCGFNVEVNMPFDGNEWQPRWQQPERTSGWYIVSAILAKVFADVKIGVLATLLGFAHNFTLALETTGETNLGFSFAGALIWLVLATALRGFCDAWFQSFSNIEKPAS